MITTRFATCLTLLLSASSAWGLTITLNPDKDNTLIQQSNPATQLSNGAGDIFSGRTNQDGQAPAVISIRRGLLHYDIAGSLPANAIITSVTLKMKDIMGLNGDPVHRLLRVLADWGQGTSFQAGGMGAAATQNDATWLYRFYNSASPLTSPAWTTPGGDFSSTVSSSTIVFDDLGGNQFFTWPSTAQFVADVQNMYDNPGSNFGWVVLGDESRGQSAKRFSGTPLPGAAASQTTANTPPPALEITYELAPAAVPEPGTLSLAILGSIAVICAVGRQKIAKRRGGT